MNGRPFRIRDAIVAVWIVGSLLGCVGGGFSMTYNILDDPYRPTPGTSEGGYRYNLSDGLWELAPVPPSEDDIEIGHRDDERPTSPDKNESGHR